MPTPRNPNDPAGSPRRKSNKAVFFQKGQAAATTLPANLVCLEMQILPKPEPIRAKPRRKR
jgi:hypothetical protein